jgi:hypothetical protein
MNYLHTITVEACCVQCAIFNVQCAVCSVQYAVCGAVCSVQSGVCSVQYVVCTVWCAVCRMSTCSVHCAVTHHCLSRRLEFQRLRSIHFFLTDTTRILVGPFKVFGFEVVEQSLSVSFG